MQTAWGAAVDPASLAAAQTEFRRALPLYASTSTIDQLRATDYSRLDALGHVYLDYTGGGLYAESQVRQHAAMLQHNVFGNPHSANLTSLAMTKLVEQARSYVLRFFNASPDEYCVIFTQSATAALKLVGESYPFGPRGHLLLTFDNHNSVNGIREFARAKGCSFSCVPVQRPDLRIAPDPLAESLERPLAAGEHLFGKLIDGLLRRRPSDSKLFAFPAQSNFSGVQHPLEWIDSAHAFGWDVLVDGAAFVPTNRLDLQRRHPDFVALSFYKIFGYPTGIGCLIARKAALAKLRRPWYSGGTITLSSVRAANERGNGYYLTPGIAGFEDGTINYLNIPAVEIGLRHIESIGMETIHTRVMCLTGWLLDKLSALHHSNGRPMIRIHGPTSVDRRGGTIAMSFHDPDGRLIDCRLVEARANRVKISLRSGCHCNPGAREVALDLSEEAMSACFKDKDSVSFEQFLHLIEGKTTGVVRVSFGLVSNFADAFRFYQFASCFRDVPPGEVAIAGKDA